MSFRQKTIEAFGDLGELVKPVFSRHELRPYVPYRTEASCCFWGLIVLTTGAGGLIGSALGQPLIGAGIGAIAWPGLVVGNHLMKQAKD